MKIALISNSNNFYFSLCRFLRDKGHDAELLLLPKEKKGSIHHPSMDSYNTDYISFTKEVTWGLSNQNNFTRHFLGDKSVSHQVENDLEPYHVLIGTQLAPAYVNLIGRNLTIQFPMGIDTRGFPFFKWKRPKRKGSLIEWNLRAIHQHRGIKKAANIVTGLNDTAYIKKIEPEGVLWEIPFPALYTPMYNPETIIHTSFNNKHKSSFEKVRAEADLMIFSHNRHGWNLYGNDRLIQAVYLLKKVKPILKVKVVFFEHGWHVNKSKALIKELGMQDCFVWFSLMPRKDLMYGLHLADIVVNELAYGALMAGTIFEAFVMGKPLIQYRNDDKYRNIFPNLPPIINVDSHEKIKDALLEFVRNPNHFKEMGQKTLDWYKKWVVQDSLEKIIGMIQNSHNK